MGRIRSGGKLGEQALEARAEQARNSAEADAKGLSAGEAEDRAKQLENALDPSPGTDFAEAKDDLVSIYQGRAREARGHHHADSGGYLDGFTPEDLSSSGGSGDESASRRDWTESSADDLVGSLASGETDPSPAVSTDDLQAALTKANAEQSVADDMGWSVPAGTAKATDELTAALKRRGSETHAALSGGEADTVLVAVDSPSGAVARVSRSEDGEGLTVEREGEPTQPAISPRQFNEAVDGASLEVTEGDDGVPEVSLSAAVPEEVTLPGVKETVEAPESGSEPGGEGEEVAALQARAEQAREMGWNSAADKADEKVAALRKEDDTEN